MRQMTPRGGLLRRTTIPAFHRKEFPTGSHISRFHRLLGSPDAQGRQALCVASWLTRLGRRTLSNCCNGRCVPHGQLIPSENRRMFQVVRRARDDSGEVTARRPLQPCFELWEDAMAMAEFDASRLWGDYGCDEEQDCWWATDTRGRKYRFVVEAAATADVAA